MPRRLQPCSLALGWWVAGSSSFTLVPPPLFHYQTRRNPSLFSPCRQGLRKDPPPPVSARNHSRTELMALCFDRCRWLSGDWHRCTSIWWVFISRDFAKKKKQLLEREELRNLRLHLFSMSLCQRSIALRSSSLRVTYYSPVQCETLKKIESFHQTESRLFISRRFVVWWNLGEIHQVFPPNSVLFFLQMHFSISVFMDLFFFLFF